MRALIGRVAIAALAVLALVLGWQLHRARQARQRAELDVGLASARVLDEKFTATGDLRVARLTGEAGSAGDCTSGFLFDDRQRTVAPFRVDYSVDLAGIDRRALRWDAKGRIMLVALPGLTIEPATVDLARARHRQSGLFISRACGLAMQRQVAGRLRAAADVRAHRADHVASAAASARASVQRLVGSTLAAAGLRDVRVRVLLATDPRRSDEQWDRSRSIEQVLGNATSRP